jgi:hypothetical protein
MDIYKQTSNDLHKVIKELTKWSRNSTARTCDACGRDFRQLDYKGETSHIAYINTSLPDKPNAFFTPFEENNTEPPTGAHSAHEDCDL